MHGIKLCCQLKLIKKYFVCGPKHEACSRLKQNVVLYKGDFLTNKVP